MDGGLVFLESAEDEIVELVQREIDDVFGAFLFNYQLFWDHFFRVSLVGSSWG